MPGGVGLMGNRGGGLNRMKAESSSSESDEDAPADDEPLSPKGKMLALPPGEEKAFVEPVKPPTPGSVEARYFIMESGDLLDTMGLSGMSIICNDNQDFIQLVCIAAQSFALQYTILYAFFQVILKAYTAAAERRADHVGEEQVPMTWMLYFLLFVAVHLHIVNCIGDIPFALNILLRISDIHDTPKELTIAAPIFFIDALVTPTLQLFIGALFVCTSPTAVDVLLNSCAVAFISSVDNWILTLLRHMKILSGDRKEVTVHIPFNAKFSQMMEASVVICPLLPVVFTGVMIKVGELMEITPSGEGTI